MIIPFSNSSVDALDQDSAYNRGLLRMLAIDFDGAGKLRKLSARDAEKLMDFEPNGRMRGVKFVGVRRPRLGLNCAG
jgi:hypothetical protein